MKKMLFGLLFLLIQVGSAQTIDGELKKWHRITLSASLPDSNLSEAESTFKNFRVDVLFSRPDGSTIRVPGFFATDGDAANSSTSEGKIFKAYLRPDTIGDWSYTLLYYEGTDVALKNINDLPEPTTTLNGNLNIIASDKTQPDLRALGRIRYATSGSDNSRRYLQYSETGKYLLKFGPDSPENFLSYEDFDRDTNFNDCGNKCFDHKYTAHANDFNTNNPTWKTNKGQNIIGAINYLTNKAQVNSMSMSLYGGDDVNVYPWTAPNKKFEYDVSKMEQWEIVLNHAEQKGLLLHFKLAEAENWNNLNTNEIKIYYREMVARFGHHLGVEWNIAEEYGARFSGNISGGVNTKVNILAQLDPWQNHRVIHTRPEASAKKLYDDLLEIDAKLTGASMQNEHGDNYTEVFSLTLDLINKSKANNTPWVVTSDEQATANRGLFNTQDPSNGAVSDQARKFVLWGNLIAGGAGVMWYGGANGDFRTENMARFDQLHAWCKYAIVDFFENNSIPFWEMENNNNLITGNNNRCLAKLGDEYVIYLPNGGTTDLDLNNTNGSFQVQWFNPRNGGDLISGITINTNTTTSIGNPPSNTDSDWVAYVKKTSDNSDDTPNNPEECDETIFIEQNGVVAIEAESFFYQSKTSKREWFVINNSSSGTPTPDPDDKHFSTASNNAYIEILPDTRVTHDDPLIGGENFTNTPGQAAIIDYKVNFSTPGKYFVWVRAYSTGPEDNGVHVGIDGTWPASGQRMQWCGNKNEWAWDSKQRTQAVHCGVPELIYLDVPNAGEHIISFSMREDGFEMDKFVLSQTYTKPSQLGPNVMVADCDTDPETPPTNENSIISPTDDAYRDNNNSLNNDLLRIENSKRTGYLKFDTSDYSSSANATLKLNVFGDNGGGTFKVYQTNNTNWTETNLTETNLPIEANEVGEFSGTYTIGDPIEVSLLNLDLTGDSTTILIKQTEGSNDIAFASDENTSTTGPRLEIEMTSLNISDINSISNIDLAAYPNPTAGDMFLQIENQYSVDQVTIYDLSGKLSRLVTIDNNQINITDLPPSVYFLECTITDRSTGQSGTLIRKIIKE